GREEHLPSELSGGEQQRVAVARSLINSPRIIFADEPTGNLDTKNADDLHQLFLSIREQFNCAFVLVTHNMELADLADRVITLKDGKVV
ncbi:MAG: lipoprotein-releasing system ATP-binding protein, partial [Arcticibacterium sp.]